VQNNLWEIGLWARAELKKVMRSEQYLNHFGLERVILPEARLIYFASGALEGAVYEISLSPTRG